MNEMILGEGKTAWTLVGTRKIGAMVNERKDILTTSDHASRKKAWKACENWLAGVPRLKRHARQ